MPPYSQKNLVSDDTAYAYGVVGHLEDRQLEVSVDTHVHRVSKRLGIIRPTINANQAHEVLARITPPTWVYTLHVHLIRHGRQVCHAQRPDCAHCPLFVACSYAGSMNPHEEHFPNSEVT